MVASAVPAAVPTDQAVDQTVGAPAAVLEDAPSLKTVGENGFAQEGTIANGGSTVLANYPDAKRLTAARSSEEPECTYIMRLFRDMECALKCLNAVATDEEIESWAMLIYASMSQQSRNYHNIQHIFNVAEGVDPIQLFASFFHDVVYFNIDDGFSHNHAVILKGCFPKDVPAIDETGSHLTQQIDSSEDPHLALVVSIFGLSPGDHLCPSQGCMNEFLSAVIAVRLLKNVLSLSDLAQIAAAIEATNPFREIDENGESPMDRLYSRLINTNETFKLGLSDDELIKATQRAADMSNRNCGSFAMTDLACFLDRTWSLLPEFSPALRQRYLFTVYDYHLAVQNMEDFFHNLDPCVVFTSFRGIPQEWEIDRFNKQSLINLDLAKKYLRAKVASLAIVAAFAELTGGNGPMCFFLGDLPSRKQPSVGDDLANFKDEEMIGDCSRSTEVYRVLTNGRNGDTTFGSREALIPAFVYGKLGDDGVRKAKEFDDAPMNKDRATALLSSLPLEVSFFVGKNIAKNAVTRTELIEELLVSLQQKELTV